MKTWIGAVSSVTAWMLADHGSPWSAMDGADHILSEQI